MDNYYRPDNWVVIKLASEKYGVVYKLLAGWCGGYLSGDSWRMNSGITSVEESTETYEINGRTRVAEYFDFYGSSGSCYRCHKDTYGLRMNNAYIWKQLQDAHGEKVSIMDEDTDWLEMDWKIS